MGIRKEAIKYCFSKSGNNMKRGKNWDVGEVVLREEGAEVGNFECQTSVLFEVWKQPCSFDHFHKMAVPSCIH